jgi:hypothetical protein
MSNFSFSGIRLISATIATLLLAAACGGGGTTVASVGSGGTGIVSGSVVKGPVGNATVTAYGIFAGAKGSQIGAASTDASGNFSMDIGAYAGPVMLQVGGGSYKDEATGAAMAMAAGDVMTAMMPAVVANANSSGIQVTPVTAMAQALALGMNGGMTDANIQTANAAMGNYFSVSDILKVQPMNPLTTGSGTAASHDSRNYGMTLASMSQYAKTLTMSASSAMVTAMMDDASDGIMNGKKGPSQISMAMGGMMGNGTMAPTAGTSSLATAMTAFTNSAANVSGLTAADMAALIQKLNNANGKI